MFSSCEDIWCCDLILVSQYKDMHRNMKYAGSTCTTDIVL